MGNNKKQVIELSNEELNLKIDRLVAIRPMANEYKALCKEVGAELNRREIDNFTSGAGNKAGFKSTPVYTWLADKLMKVLPRSIWALLLPRKPDVKKLNQRLAATPEDKRLAACRIMTGAKKQLEVLAMGETHSISAGDDDEDEEALAAA